MLKLADLEPFAIGGTRRCYVHPQDEQLCVKILRPDRTPAARHRKAKGWRRLKGERGFDDQRKECKAYDALLKRGQRNWRHVPRYHGTVATDQGIGIVTDLQRNYDGRFPLNLEELLPNGMTETISTAIGEFQTWLRRDLFLSRDLLPHNIIAVAESPRRYRLMIVDGIGNSEMLPLSSWFKACARRKVERKIRKFNMRVSILLPTQDHAVL